MDKNFVEKMASIAGWKKAAGGAEQTAYDIGFSAEEEGIIAVSSEKGSFTYKLKTLNELYSCEKADTTDKDRLLNLLFIIESLIKRHYEREGRRGYLDFIMEYVP